MAFLAGLKEEGVEIREPSDRFSYLFDRFLAKFVDYLLALSLEHAGFLLGSSWLAWLAATAYILVADGLPGGKSLGKRLSGLWVSGRSGDPCSFYESTIRNIPLGLAYILSQIPWIGWALGLLVASVEGLILAGMPSDRRFGDDLVGTMVRKGAFGGIERRQDKAAEVTRAETTESTTP
ncbi:MAG: RDD family protein [Nitrospirae bacterium]|nr:RDD family protein [Nitrospirota bacterium]